MLFNLQLVKQTGPAGCGPAVVAMLTGRAVSELPEIIEDGRSPVERMQSALSQFALTFTEIGDFRDLPLPVNTGAFLIEVETSQGKRFKHWIAFDGKRIFDPKFGIRKTLRRTTSETVKSAVFYAVFQKSDNNG